MNELLKKLQDSLKTLWSKWTMAQKIILFGIVAAALGAVVFVFSFSATPSTVKLFNVAITDETARANILFRLSEENVEATVSDSGVISVADNATAQRMRAILKSENLVPNNVDPWNLFNMQRWTTSDFENNVNLRRSIINQITQHIEALDDVDSAQVIVTMPEKALFSSEQKPVTASIIIRAKPNSDIYSNPAKIKGIQKLAVFALEGLTEENITIADSKGNTLNNFEEMREFDRVALVQKERQIVTALETDLKQKVLAALRETFSADRVRDLNVRIEMDMSKVSSQATVYSPIVKREDNPDTPYDDSEMLDYLPIASQTVKKVWEGTGLQPQGPAGTDGQNPPVYSDANTMIGRSEESGVIQNNALNEKHIQEERSPSPGRTTVSVNIDGTWNRKYDEKGNLVILANGTIDREYVPIESGDLAKATDLVQNAIGYNRNRGDSVTVQNIRFDRTAQFYTEDLEYIRRMETRRTVFMVLGGVAFVLLAFMAFRFITKERERRRRLREEELLRKRQMERDKSLWEAEQGAMEVTMSVEERRRAELQENAIAMAKEHPEDVAMLVRTWLMEE